MKLQAMQRGLLAWISDEHTHAGLAEAPDRIQVLACTARGVYTAGHCCLRLLVFKFDQLKHKGEEWGGLTTHLLEDPLNGAGCLSNGPWPGICFCGHTVQVAMPPQLRKQKVSSPSYVFVTSRSPPGRQARLSCTAKVGVPRGDKAPCVAWLVCSRL